MALAGPVTGFRVQFRRAIRYCFELGVTRGSCHRMRFGWVQGLSSRTREKA